MSDNYPLGRNEIIQTINHAAENKKFWILCGKAGSGKTLVMDGIASQELHPLHSSRLVNKTICNQSLFEALLAKELSQKPLRFIVEDKGRKVAQLSLPEKLLFAWSKAEHFEVEAPLEERVNNIFHAHVASENDHEKQRLFIESKKDRLGELLFSRIKNLFERAVKNQDQDLHKDWIRYLLVEHLDPIYEHYKHHKSPKIVLRGYSHSLLSQMKLLAENLKRDETKTETMNNLENLEKTL